MAEIKITQQKAGWRGQPNKWLVEYPGDEWNPGMVNCFDTFEAAAARAKEIAPLITCGGPDPTRLGTLACLAKNILDPLPPLKFGAGRGDTVSVSLPSGGHRLVSKRTARRMGMKTSRSKPKTS